MNLLHMQSPSKPVKVGQYRNMGAFIQIHHAATFIFKEKQWTDLKTLTLKNGTIQSSEFQHSCNCARFEA